MKNNRIVRAYDSINPSIADKQKMLDAILAEANLEEKPEKVRKKREPVIYTGRPTKTSKRSLIGPLAACFAVLILAGVFLMHLSREPVNPAFEEPTTEKINVTVNFDYSDVLQKYRTALREGWSKEQCEIEGISTRFYMPEPVDFTVGQRILDINNDGKAELLIGHDDIIWDLYTTLEDGTPIQLLSDVQDGWQYYLNADGLIAAEYFSKEDCYAEYYTLKGHQLEMELQLEYRDGQWKQQKAGQDWEAIIADSAEATMNSFERFTPDWVPFLDHEQIDSDAMERYMLVLEKYRTALAEGWPSEMCVDNDLSAHTPVANEYDGLYYALSDLDGNGTQELVISEQPYREGFDTGFMDLYTIEDGTATRILSDAELLSPSLCEGGIVKSPDPQDLKCNKYVGFRKLTDSMLNLEIAVYEIDGQWFNEGYRRVGAAITREEADEIAASFKPLRLDFIAIAAPQKEDTLTGYKVFDQIIGTYATAIHEGWTEHQCEQNDISPQILSDTCIQYNLGWCLLDIDGNSVEELIVSDGVHLFDLYVMMPHDGSPGHLVMANGGESWQLCENGVIQKHGLYSGTTAWRYYTLRDIDLVQRDMVFYEGATNQYSYGTSDHDLRPIAKEKAGEIIGRDRTMELSLTKFVDPEPFVPDEQKYYEPLLDIYRQAIREDWNPGQCVENGISLMVGNYGDFVEALGYTTMDLDSNGIQELLITDGTNIYDLYTIVQNEEIGPLRLVDAMERIEYFLTEDSMIYCSGSGGAGMHVYSLSSLEGQNLRMMTGFMYAPDTDAENPWFWYDGEEQGDPCGYDAQSIIDNWKTVRIPFVSFE